MVEICADLLSTKLWSRTNIFQSAKSSCFSRNTLLLFLTPRLLMARSYIHAEYCRSSGQRLLTDNNVEGHNCLTFSKDIHFFLVIQSLYILPQDGWWWDHISWWSKNTGQRWKYAAVVQKVGFSRDTLPVFLTSRWLMAGSYIPVSRSSEQQWYMSSTDKSSDVQLFAILQKQPLSRSSGQLWKYAADLHTIVNMHQNFP